MTPQEAHTAHPANTAGMRAHHETQEATMQEAEEIIADYFAFEAATRGPESKFAIGDRVKPAFRNEHTDELGLGTVTGHIPPNRAYRGVGALIVKWQNGLSGTWAHDAIVKVSVDGLRTITAKHAGTCGGCGQKVAARTHCYWSTVTRKLYHVHCA